MIIEGIEEQLVVGVRRVDGRSTSDREAEKSRHVVFDHSTTDRVDLPDGQHIEQGRARDELSIAPAVGQQPPESWLYTAVDDHRVVRQRQ